MAIKTINIEIDLLKKNNEIQGIVSQQDNITLNITIKENEQNKIVTNQATALYCKRANNTVVEQKEGITILNNVVTIKCKNSCFAVKGIAELQLIFSDSTGNVSTLCFYLEVKTKLANAETVPSRNEIDAITSAIENIENKSLEMVNKTNQIIESVSEKSSTRLTELDNYVNEKKRILNNKIDTATLLADNKIESLENKINAAINKTDTNIKKIETKVTSAEKKVDTDIKAIDKKVSDGLEELADKLEEGLMNAQTELSRLNNKTILATNEANSLIEAARNNIEEAEVLLEKTSILNEEVDTKLNEIDEKADTLLSEIDEDYKSLQSAIVDENAVANIQSQVNSIKKEISEKLKNDVRISTEIEKIRLDELSEEVLETIKNSSGGSGGGGGSIIGTITSTFDKTIATIDEEIIIPYFFSTPNIGRGTVHVEINGIEKTTGIASMGQNNINIGTLDKGRNSINLYVIDRAGVYTNILTFTVDCGTIEIVSTFDYEIDYDVSDQIRFPFTVDTISTRPINVVFTIDDNTYNVAATKGYNIYTFPPVNVGVNKVTVQAFSGDYVSNKIEFNLIVVNSTELYVSSLFNKDTIQEGDNISIDYRISMQNQKTFNVEYYIDGKMFRSLEARLGTNYWRISTLKKGARTLKIKVSTKDGSQIKELNFSINVTESEYKMVEPVTSGLAAWFDATDLSNNDENREIWQDKSGNNVVARLQGFNFGNNGWQNNSLVCNGASYVEIELKPFSSNCRLGTTIDIQFNTRDVGDSGARIFDCSSDVGSKLGAYIDTMNCHLTSLENKFKEIITENEKIRVTYVIDRDKKMAKIYINAILTAVKFLSDRGNGNDKILENFQHEEKIYLNSRKGIDSFGECEIYNLRVYGRALSDEEVLTNHIADIKDKVEQKKKYDFNFNDVMPTMYFYGDTSAMTKENPVNLRIKYIATEGYGQSFDLDNCIVNWQGTSSLQYAVKNYKIKLRNTDGSKYKHALHDNWIKESTFTLKADYMESSHANNTGLAKIVGKYLYDTPIPPQEDDERIRTTVSGFPIKLYINDEVMGVFNFNLDKKDDDSFGLNKKKYKECVSYEVAANSNITAGAFNKWTSASGVSERDYYLADFELRYPSVNEEEGIGEDYKMLTSLKRVVDWVSDASDEEFKTELEQYFNKEYLIKYYIHTMLFGMVDNFGKNMMLTTWDGNIWFPTFYDLDSCLGLDNTGYLKFDCDIEMSTGVFNTSSSKLWVKLQRVFSKEIKEVYKKLRSTKYNYDNFMSILIGEQIDRIPEALYNLDCQTKYLAFGKEYLHMLHGSRKEHLKRWVKERILFLDTVWEYDADTASSITLRANKQGAVYLDIQTYSPMYFKVVWRNNEEQILKVNRNQTVRFSSTLPTSTDQEVIVYAAKYIKDLGDLTNLNPSSMLIGNATRLTKLKCTSAALLNVKVDGMSFLRELDLTNCTALGSGAGGANVIDVSKMTSLRVLKLTGTAITSIITPQNGCNLEKIYYPNNIQNIDLRNMENLKEINVPYSASSSNPIVAANLLNFTVINCPKLITLGNNLYTFKPLTVCENIYIENSFHDMNKLTFDSFKILKSITLKNINNTSELNFRDYFPKTTENIKISDCSNLTTLKIYQSFNEKTIIDISKNPKLTSVTLCSSLLGDLLAKKILLSPSVTEICRASARNDRPCKINVKSIFCPEDTEHDDDFEGIDLKQEFTEFFNYKTYGIYINDVPYVKELHLNSTSCYGLFNGNTSLTKVDILTLGENVVDCESMFYGCSNLTDIGDFKIPKNVTKCNSMFSGCNNLIIKSLSLEGLKANCNYMFTNCEKITNLDWLNIGDSLISCSNMFSYSGLEYISNLTIDNENVDSMFAYCKKLVSIENLIFNNAKKIGSLFSGCNKLENINGLTIEGEATNAGYLFSGCASLTNITEMQLPNSLTSIENMFNGAGTSDLQIKNLNISNITTSQKKSFYFNQLTSLDLRFDGVIKYNIFTSDFAYKTLLTLNSLISILNALEDRIGNTTLNLDLGRINLNKLSDTQKAIALNKNWTLT